MYQPIYEERLPIGTRVRTVKANNASKQDYLNYTGIITKDWQDHCPYVVEFEDKLVEERNRQDGKWCWMREELEVLSAVEPVPVIPADVELLKDDRVILIALYPHEKNNELEEKMKPLLAQSGRIISIMKGADFPFDVEFDGETAQDYCEHLGGLSFAKEELLCINGTDYKNPSFEWPEEED